MSNPTTRFGPKLYLQRSQKKIRCLKIYTDTISFLISFSLSFKASQNFEFSLRLHVLFIYHPSLVTYKQNRFPKHWINDLGVEGNVGRQIFLETVVIAPQEILKFLKTSLYISMQFFILMHAKSFQSYLTLCDPMDHSPAGSSVLGILQARIQEWFTMPFSRGQSQPGSPVSSALLAVSLPLARPGKPLLFLQAKNSDRLLSQVTKKSHIIGGFLSLFRIVLLLQTNTIIIKYLEAFDI